MQGYIHSTSYVELIPGLAICINILHSSNVIHETVPFGQSNIPVSSIAGLNLSNQRSATEFTDPTAETHVSSWSQGLT